MTSKSSSFFILILSLLGLLILLSRFSTPSPDSKTTFTFQTTSSPLSPTSHLATQSYKGRVSALLIESSQSIWIGYEGGWISHFNPHTQAQDHLHWLAHEGAVRSLQPHTVLSSQKHTSHESASLQSHFYSVGADGTWAGWTPQGRSVWRRRQPKIHVNQALPLNEKRWAIATDQGMVMVVEKEKRIWRTAGEHQRATFALLIDDPSTQSKERPSQVRSAELLSVGSDGFLRRWTQDHGKSQGAYRIHQGWATCLIWADEDKKHILTAGSDGQVKLWARHPQSKTPLAYVKQHSKTITRLVRWKDYVASGGEDGRIHLYRLSFTPIPKLTWIRELTHSPAHPLKGPVLTLGWDPRLKVLYAGGGELGDSRLWRFSLDDPSQKPVSFSL